MTRTNRLRWLLPPGLALTAAVSGCELSDLFLGSDRVVSGSGGAGGTAGTESTGGGSGGALACVPGATRACYDGPGGTEGVGTCHAGTQACASNGMTWGPCLGEVLPAPPNCVGGKDLHCDGYVQACKGTLLWAKRFGDSNDQRGAAITVDAAGDVLIAGSFAGSVDFGGGPLMSTGGSTAFVAKLDGSSGSFLWAKGYGTGAALGVAVAPSGDVLVTGDFSGSADFGDGQPIASTGKKDAFIVALSAGGGYKWSKHFGSPGTSAGATGVAVDAAGHVVVTGSFAGSVDFGSGQPVTSTGPQDVFLTKLDASGGYVWSEHFGASNDQGPLANAVAVDTSGDVLLTGSFAESVDFGGGPLASIGATDAFALELDAAGSYRWLQHFGSPGEFSNGSGIAADASGNVFVAGNFAGSLSFGGGGSPVMASGDADAFLLSLDALSGATSWSEHFGAGSTLDSAGAGGVVVDIAGNVLVTGAFTGAVKFGGQPIFSSGEQDVFLAKLDPSGGAVWPKTFGDPSSTQAAAGVAADASENVLVTGFFSGSIDFGEGPLVSMGGMDIFVAKLGP
jgi:hypothetical protein